MRRGGSLEALAVFVLAAAVLASGTGFDLDPFDSAELALVAVTRGLGHPPGQPLHTLVGWIVTRGPWRPLAALAWLSLAPFAALLALASVRALRETPAAVPSLSRRVGAVLVAVLAAALPAVRDAVCRVEVYALAAALASGAVLVATRRSSRAAYGAGVLLGLAAATNPVVAVQGAGAVWLLGRGRGRASLGALVRLGAGGLLGLGVYGYAFGVAGREDVTLVWGAPHDARSLWTLLTARDFQQNVSLSFATLLRNLAHLGMDLGRGATLLYLLLGAVGLWIRVPADDPAGPRSPLRLPFVWALGIGALMIAANVPYRPANPDYGGYLLVAVALAAVGAVRLVRVASPRFASLALVLGGACTALAVPPAFSRGRPSGATRALASEALRALPPGALAVVGSDHRLFPMLYLQLVEGVRPDVTVLNPGWSSSRWAWQHARARDPSLVVDLTPGRGGNARLLETLRARAPGRAVVAESLPLLRAAAPGAVCPRGGLWSSAEGCESTRREVERTTALLASLAAAAPRDSWDARIVQFTGRALGDDALRLGCRGFAARYYAAALGEAPSAGATGPGCDGRPLEPPPAPGLLEFSAGEVHRARAALSSR